MFELWHILTSNEILGFFELLTQDLGALSKFIGSKYGIQYN